MKTEHKKECKLLLLPPLEAMISKASSYQCISKASQTYLCIEWYGRNIEKSCFMEPAALHLGLGLDWGRLAFQAVAFLVITKAYPRNIMHLKIEEYSLHAQASSTSRMATHTCMKPS